MGTKKLDTEIRQEQIAQAALSLVASQGMRGLSVANVARKVGLVPSAIYRHFKGKDQILAAVLELLGDKTGPRNRPRLPYHNISEVLPFHFKEREVSLSSSSFPTESF